MGGEFLRDAFNLLRVGHDLIETSPFTSTELKQDVDNHQNSHSDQLKRHEQERLEQKQIVIDVHENPMESVMPIERWKIMSLKSRHHFLDQFYTIRQKYRYEREADESCAAEELQLFECQQNGPFRWSQLFDRKLSWQERLDACGKLASAHEKCIVTASMDLKCRIVFGKEAWRYVQVVESDFEKQI